MIGSKEMYELYLLKNVLSLNILSLFNTPSMNVFFVLALNKLLIHLFVPRFIYFFMFNVILNRTRTKKCISKLVNCNYYLKVL